MKKFYSSVVALAMVCVAQMAKAETYNAWGAVLFTYIQTPMYDAGETIEVTADSIFFTSGTWGEGGFAIATGEGALAMDNHRGGVSNYAANISGTVADGVFVISVPSVMGGTVITSTLGEMPAAVAVAGKYTGGTYANSNYFSGYQPTADQTVTITANEGYATATLTHTSATWGTFTFSAVCVVANADGSYTLTGEGTCAMPSMADPTQVKDYASDLTATIADGVLVAEMKVPAVMGGTTLLFNPSDFETVGIGSVVANGSDDEASAVTLNGQRAADGYNGIVVKNGKKVLVK
ncbi:MAG: calycin-like domain-containing protein [Bacteroidales bacterium]|nr:calycin-like domain-containing protein [Bacteroidales bacterium]